VTLEKGEIVRARLVELAPAGFEEVEAHGEIEFAVYADEAAEQAIRAAFVDVTATAIDQGWEDRWREFHRPVRAGGLWIGPPWEGEPGEDAVVVDPGRAFGTGAHPTTRACIELLAVQARGSLLDAGCGSGVVAVAAARLGFDPVTAVDMDDVAVAATRENAVRNGVQLDVRRLDVLQDVLPWVDLVVANIELSAVEALLVRRPAARAITSGYPADEAPDAPGWTSISTVELEGWRADLCEPLS
jgi:ribosomal protein L11 methyltransferase